MKWPTRSDPQRVRTFAVEGARLLGDRHCEDICLLDVRTLSQVCDYVLIATGTSDRQMKSIAQELDELGDEHDSPLYRMNADPAATWIVIDFVDVVVHLFEPERRAYYDLESLWSDAEEVVWQQPRSATGGAGKR